jgi:site-specific recombinase XerD
MVKRRARAAGVSEENANHTFRATGITLLLQGGAALETAQRIAGHARIDTTRVYDRRDDEITVAEIERIRLV